MKRSILLPLAFLAGCASNKAPPAAAPAPSPSEGSVASPATPSPASDEAASKATADAAPSAASANAPGASGALAASSGELEKAHRDLELAAGDCTNACRALGSMDRAAGKLCTLARSTDERDRCGEAKVKVQNARDRVKRTCGSCPEVTVDRNASIPSR